MNKFIPLLGIGVAVFCTETYATNDTRQELANNAEFDGALRRLSKDILHVQKLLNDAREQRLNNEREFSASSEEVSGSIPLPPPPPPPPPPTLRPYKGAITPTPRPVPSSAETMRPKFDANDLRKAKANLRKIDVNSSRKSEKALEEDLNQLSEAQLLKHLADRRDKVAFSISDEDSKEESTTSW